MRTIKIGGGLKDWSGGGIGGGGAQPQLTDFQFSLQLLCSRWDFYRYNQPTFFLQTYLQISNKLFFHIQTLLPLKIMGLKFQSCSDLPFHHFSQVLKERQVWKFCFENLYKSTDLFTNLENVKNNNTYFRHVLLLSPLSLSKIAYNFYFDKMSVYVEHGLSNY